MQILDKIKLDMYKFESRSYLATLRRFGYEEMFRTFIGRNRNPSWITLVLIE